MSSERGRSRLVTSVLLAVTVGLGLASRTETAAETSPWLHRNAGDALWAVCVYLGLVSVRPTMAARSALISAAAICLAVELSQLSEAGWLEAIRSTRLGRLLIGVGWQTVDLARYSAGLLLAFALDRGTHRS